MLGRLPGHITLYANTAIPANSLALLDTWNEAQGAWNATQYAQDDAGLSSVIVPEAIAAGDLGRAYLADPHLFRDDPNYVTWDGSGSVAAGDRVGAKANSWYARTDPAGAWLVLRKDGTKLWLRFVGGGDGIIYRAITQEAAQADLYISVKLTDASGSATGSAFDAKFIATDGATAANACLPRVATSKTILITLVEGTWYVVNPTLIDSETC